MTPTLIAILGNTPQIITETLYALLQAGAPLPVRIQFVTTSEGEKSLAPLLGANNQIERFAYAYGLTDWYAALEVVKPWVPLEDGAPIPDVDTLARGDAMRALIFRVIAEACADPQNAVHVSLAGGRKTMSFLAGQAMELFGRAQDRLTHVLLNPLLENNPEFFFPPLVPGPIRLKDRSKAEFEIAHAEVRIVLADVPFVRLRSYLRPEWADNPLELIGKMQDAITPPLVLHSCKLRMASFAGVQFQLSETLYAWLLLLAEQLERHQADPSVASGVSTRRYEKDDFMTTRAVFALARVQKFGLNGVISGSAAKLRKNLEADDPVFSDRHHKLKIALRKVLGADKVKRLFDDEKQIAGLRHDVGICIEDRGGVFEGTNEQGHARNISALINREFSILPEAQRFLRQFLRASQSG
jgi:CRISPR-associated protein (TIGR02584 family)